MVCGMSSRSTFFVVLIALGLTATGCARDNQAQPPEADAEVADDAGLDTTDTDTVGADADSEDTSDAPDTPPDVPGEPPVWDPRLPDTAALGTIRGLRVARGIVHLHTIHSHDACDGQPRIDGEFNEPCLQDWRDAVCATRQDVVFTTEHEEHAAEVDFEELLLVRRSDRVILRDGAPIGNALACPDGHTVVVLPGGEFDVMPVAMDAHWPGTVEERTAFYENATPLRVAQLRDQLGAVVLQAHTEGRDIADLRRLGLDGFEIYNLHANIDPEIREADLGLEPWGFTQGVQPFLGREGPEPDLVLLGFLAPSPPALLAFDQLLWEGRKLVGTGGNDAHQNSLPIPMRDGERVDSYRRMMRFVTHHFLVEAPTADAYEEALRNGRVFVVFETFATPLGLDFHAERDGVVTEMGDRAPRGSTLHVARPRVAGHEDEVVSTTIVLIKAENGGGVPVAEATDSDLDYAPPGGGVFRAEIRITPTHLTPWLGSEPDQFLVPTPWVYTNPVYVN